MLESGVFIRYIDHLSNCIFQTFHSSMAIIDIILPLPSGASLGSGRQDAAVRLDLSIRCFLDMLLGNV